jgi:hypothetical protein
MNKNDMMYLVIMRNCHDIKDQYIEGVYDNLDIAIDKCNRYNKEYFGDILKIKLNETINKKLGV